MPLVQSAVLAPVTDDHPCGPDIRAEGGLGSPYFKLKDARAQARMSERNAEASGEPVAVPAEWAAVRDISVDILSHRSRDVEVGAWLMEAMLRLDGFRGFAEAANLMEAMVDRFWPDLHSIDEDDAAGRLSPLAGLNGVGGEGALVQPLRMVSLLPDTPFGTHALWHVARAHREPNGEAARLFHDARANADAAALRDRAQQAQDARAAFAKLTATLDARCGDAAPPSSNIRNVLDEVADAYRAMLGGEPVAEAAPAAEAPPEIDAPTTPAASAGPREIRTREEAFTELLRIADFFRRNEPHSPIASALTTLVTRGRMNFVDLLQELLPDAAQRKQVLEHAGIQVNAAGQTT